MAKIKTKAKSRYPGIVKENGLQDIWKSGRIEVVKEPDEENPKRTVERLRVKEVYTSLKMITEVQKNCALRYALLVEKALGATQDLYAQVKLVTSGRSKWEPSAAQHEAYEKLFKIWVSVGKYHIEILNMIILANIDCRQVAEHKGFNQYYVAGVVMSAFIKLEEAFEEVDNG